MRVSDFRFDLPPELVAEYPKSVRSDSRLLVLEDPSRRPVHRAFRDIVEYLQAGDLLVLNDTRVIPARLFSQKATGGKVEMLVERIVDERTVWAHLRASKSPACGSRLTFEGGCQARIVERRGDLFVVAFECEGGVLDYLNSHGHMPLPPYLNRPDDSTDRERYQTVYARKEGAVAAPTAGLHFDHELLDRLRARGVNMTRVTLHVGAGTFQPVRVEQIEEHSMHSEYMEVSEEVVQAVGQARACGGRVVAVGTTAVRCLETAARTGTLAPFVGDTDIFIYPGYRYRVVDALVTNFHLPESTLLMLVAAFYGYEPIMAAYREAVAARYRFYSYGDAMFLAHVEGCAAPSDRVCPVA